MKPSKNSILMKLLMVPYLILRKRFGQHSQVQKIEKISISGFLDDIFVERENRQKIASWIFITGVLVIFWITIFKKKIMILISKSVLNWSTLFENYSKCRIWFLNFPPIFVLLKLACLVTLFDRKLQVFRNLPNWRFLAFLINFWSLTK